MRHVKIAFVIILLAISSCAGDADENAANDATGDTIQTSGFSSLITITDESQGDNCESGGKRIDTGLDNGDGGEIPGDGVLQSLEIDQTEYVCNGVNGGIGISGEDGSDGTNGTDGINGEDGINGTDGINGSNGIDGIAGSDGQDGINGKDGTDGSNGTSGSDGEDGSDSVTDAIITYNLSGNLQKGPCFADGEILIQPLDSSMDQIGTHYIGFTNDNFGAYDIPAEIAGLYAEVFFEGDCHNEITGGFGSQRLSGIVKVTDLINNINPLTKIRSIVARDIFTDNIDTSLLSAEILILNYLGMPALSKRFTEMNLEEAGEHDAVLALVNSMILYDRSEAEQGDYIIEIANGVIENDQDLKTEIADTIAILPIVQIKNNLETRYTELGMDIDVPPFWRLGYPDYYVDLLERDPIAQGSLNSASTSGCSMDLPYKRYAIPAVFESWIETSNYIASNLGGNISIWTRGTHADGYDAPETKIMDVEQLREKLLDSSLYHHGMIENHSLQSGDEVYFVAEKETGWILSKGCNADLLPFGRVLASHDGGETYIGHDNNTLFFRRGLSITGFD